jgi:hypothetical protein
LDATNLARVTVGEMFSSDGKPSPRITRLLTVMHKQTSVVKPADLGIIGKQNLMHRFEALGADLDSFQYKRILSSKAELPYVIEVAFAYVPAETEPRVLVTGINFSPAIVNPFANSDAVAKVWSGSSLGSVWNPDTRSSSRCTSPARWSLILIAASRQWR